MAKIVERTRRDGSKVWWVTWREADDKHLAQTFNSKDEAEAYLAGLRSSS